LTLDSGETIYNIGDRTIEGGDSDIAEDLRDYLRRRGIKFFTDRGFKSI
jgi:pyruvate/2-oxoglutarate dehydrogenase complex dihydrolipoamide dehydrogenase (E3) component